MVVVDKKDYILNRKYAVRQKHILNY